MSNQTGYPALFAPLKIGKYTLKNRVVSSPHSGGPNLYRHGDNGFSNMTESCAQYFTKIARGGAAIVNTGHLGVDPRYMLGSNQETFNFYGHIHEHTLPVLHMMSDGIHSFGSLASFELNHCGHYGTPVGRDTMLGPVACTAPNGREVVAMDEAEMSRVADYFANAAVIGKRGGFDIINVHAAHNWLLGNFFSPVGNTRTDEYGGSVENRARFPLMVIKRIRQAIGNDMLISMRFSVCENIKGGITLDEAAETIKLFEPYVNIVQCSAGKIHNPLSSSILFPMPYAPHGTNAHLCKEMKDRGVRAVLETIGGVNEPEMAEQLVASGTVDLVGMARSFIADPDWAEKARHGKADEIRPCIRCLRCLNYANPPQTGTSVCTVNPYRIMPHPVAPSLFKDIYGEKKVAVIGGGAAGMAAALKLSRKGHTVELFEQSDKLGGVLHFSDHVAFKDDVRRYRDYLIHMIGQQDKITVHMATKATPDMVKAGHFDAVVVAIGAEKFIPNIPGVDGDNVIHALDLFGNEDKLGKKIVVVGGGFVGCEATVHLQTKGKQVDMVEMTDELMTEAKHIEEERFLTEYFMTHQLDLTKTDTIDIPEIDAVQIHLSSKCVEITESGVYIEKHGQRIFLEADTVIMSTGFRANQGAVDGFQGTAFDVVNVGDCKRVGDLLGVSSGAYEVAARI